MPDKIWLHKDTKYNTGDIVSAYQYEFAQGIEDEGIENFAEYVPADAFIEKACDWLRIELVNFEDYIGMGETFIKDFKNYMKGE